MSLGRRLGRLARGFVSDAGGGGRLDERFMQRVDPLRARGERLKSAFDAARRGFAEEWRSSEERMAEEEQEKARAERESEGRSSWRFPGEWRADQAGPPPFVPRRYPPEVLYAYHRLGLGAGDPLEVVNRKRRELVKRHHPDKFVEPGQRARAERLTAEINAAHDLIERHLKRHAKL